MRVFLSIAGVLIFVGGLAAGYLEHPQVLWVSCVGFVGCLIAANLDRISEFTASTRGVTARTREVITRAESAVTQLQSLAAVVAEVTLSLVKRSGRLGGYTDVEEESIRDRVSAILENVSVPRHEWPRIFKEWRRITEFDYVHYIIGGNMIPNVGEGAAMEEWKALRAGGIGKVVTPDEVREYLTKHAFMTPERETYLEDYEHYRQHGEHRRPSVWRQREEWGRLEQPRAS